MALRALLSACVADLTSSSDVICWKSACQLRSFKPSEIVLTMNLQTMLKTKLAAGHSGQKRTTSRSEIRLSRMVRYSASFAFFVDLLFPDLSIK